MLEGQMQPLAVAKRVLTQETIVSVSQSPFTLRAWKILDRWALNSPRQLKELEAKGINVLHRRVLEQQTTESKALLTMAESLDRGMAEHEVLELAEVQTELA